MVENLDINLPFFNLKLSIHKNTEVIFRYFALVITFMACSLWIITGNDSTLYGLFYSEPEKLFGGGIHWLVLVLMPFFYWLFSYQLSKHNIHKLRNIIYSFVFATGFVNATFELLWIFFYDLFHNFGNFYITLPFLYGRGFLSWWVMIRTFYWLGFGLLIMYFIKQHYGFEWRLKSYVTEVLFIFTVGFWFIWIIAPFSFEVVRGSYFPQYIYAEFTDLTYIIPIFVRNSTVFLINTLTKLFHFLFIAWVFFPKFKKVRKW